MEQVSIARTETNTVGLIGIESHLVKLQLSHKSEKVQKGRGLADLYLLHLLMHL